VFSGVQGSPAANFPTNAYTTLATTPISREKPFLYLDASGAYQVFVPSLRTNASGVTWANGAPAGNSLPLSQFYVVKAGDSLNAIARRLGVSHATAVKTISRVKRAGLATARPYRGVFLTERGQELAERVRVGPHFRFDLPRAVDRQGAGQLPPARHRRLVRRAHGVSRSCAPGAIDASTRRMWKPR